MTRQYAIAALTSFTWPQRTPGWAHAGEPDLGPSNITEPKRPKNCASAARGDTCDPNFDVTVGTMLRNVASYLRTAPLAALTSKAALRVEGRSRRKASWGGDNVDAGGKTSWLSGAADAERSGGAETDPATSSSNATGQGRLALDRSRST